ncbi:exodeoxyribonuclease V subunit alpha [Thiorhodococcus minor]|uniref:RecBCD enzyme subunit RecD n=2 Tax=Thiorhodococcus minor TaxID=57489 RepID=A0A6M0JYP6_9GAMM|nr:exodeoxyribonuclease V subunit alpha [Thiorhodococcus minor]
MVLLAIALVSERNGHGHVCLDLAAALAQPEALLGRLRDDARQSPEVRADLAGLLAGLSPRDWAMRLAISSAVTDLIPLGWTSTASPPPRSPLAPGAGGLRAVEDRTSPETLEHAPRPPYELRDSDAGWMGAANPPDSATPFVLAGSPDRTLLYLRRYWNYETRIRQGILERLGRPSSLPEDKLRKLLDLVFQSQDRADPWPKIACALAARSPFAIITGGPGTGKTTTVVRLLAVLQGLALSQDEPPLRIRLAAPTGKAAARLNESIAGRVAELPFAELPDGERMPAEIPTEVTTLHRLLGPIPDSRHFRHHAGNPLPADLVVVDEASMVDVEMMAKLFDALRPSARLILLGDKDQLASVEAGAVLGDLCQRARAAHYTRETGNWLEQVTGARVAADAVDPGGRPLDQGIAMLRNSYRFKAEGGIGALAELVNEGILDHQVEMDRFGAVRQLFARSAKKTAKKLGLIHEVRLKGEHDPALDALIRKEYGAYFAAIADHDPGDTADAPAIDGWARTVLEAYARFQLLTGLRRGTWGVEGLNARVIAVLGVRRPRAGPAQRGVSGEGWGSWFPGRSVLVTRNDYGLRLMNGDIGITLEVPVRREDGRLRRALRVAFPAGDGSGGIRWVLPSRLQAVETAFAMTVHKSQGSEFDHTALVLPDKPSPVLTRELIYTAITRSKDSFTLLYRADGVLRDALERQVLRMSGLSAALAVAS